MKKITREECGLTQMNYDEFVEKLKNKDPERMRKVFKKIVLKYIVFDFEKIEHVSFESCIFEKVSFQEMELKNINFKKCILRNCSFYGADIKHNRFAECHLIDVNFKKANLYQSNLGNWCKLENVDFSGANVAGVVFSDSTLIDTNLDYSAFPLHCGSFGMKTDEEMLYQLLYHACKLDINTVKAKRIQNQLIPFANEWRGIEEHALSKLSKSTPNTTIQKEELSIWKKMKRFFSKD